MSDQYREQNKERGDAVLAIFKRGAEFTKQIIDDNERLRRRVNEVETRQQQASTSDDDWAKLRVELSDRIQTLEAENQSIMEHLQLAETENHQFAERYLEIEEENNNLANLYVASYQLHATLDPNEVLKVIIEIVINLIGAEVFCVYVYDQKSGVLEPVASEGQPTGEFPRVLMGSGFVGAAVENGEVVEADADTRVVEIGGKRPEVCIPLRVEGRAVGAIVIYNLLAQKDGFTPLDRELFTLLAGHAATAIFASQLYAQSERKLSTIKGFIELLTK